MYAVVRTGGKQYCMEPGDLLDVELLSGEPGDSVEMNEVLLLDDGQSVQVGKPTVVGASVRVQIVEQLKGPKILIFKKIRRHGKQLTKGHRQSLTRIRVEQISASTGA